MGQWNKKTWLRKLAPGWPFPALDRAHVNHQDDCAWLQRYESWSNFSAAGERSRWPVACPLLEKPLAQPVKKTISNRRTRTEVYWRQLQAHRKRPKKMVCTASHDSEHQGLGAWWVDTLVERSWYGPGLWTRPHFAACYDLPFSKRPSRTTSLSFWKTTAPMWKTWRCSHVECAVKPDAALLLLQSSSSIILLPTRSCRLMWTPWMDVW